MWRQLLSSAVAVGLWLLALQAPVAADEEAWSRFKGQVVISDVLLAPSFGSDRVMITSLSRMRVSTVQEVGDFWRLHLVAFLDPGADGHTLHVVARDITAPADRSRARSGSLPALRVFETSGEPGQKVLHMNDLVLTEAMGFQRGHDYEVSVENDPGPSGKEDVYAQGVVTLR
jgi:hypothetical protein